MLINHIFHQAGGPYLRTRSLIKGLVHLKLDFQITVHDDAPVRRNRTIDEGDACVLASACRSVDASTPLRAFGSALSAARTTILLGALTIGLFGTVIAALLIILITALLAAFPSTGAFDGGLHTTLITSPRRSGPV